jgi:hypothetical protein
VTYIVMVRSTKMPSSVKARYLKVALVKVGPGYDQQHQPHMISHRAKGVIEIVDLRDRLHAGGGQGTAAAKAIRELEAEADRLNSTTETSK